MKIGVIGAGYVGLTAGACLAGLGHEVVCSDNDEAKLQRLQAGEVPFFEPNLADLIAQSVAASLLRFASPAEAVAAAEAVFICVGTPPLPNGDADLSSLDNAARLIAARAAGYRLVISKSTVPVRTAQQLRKQLKAYSRGGLDYDVVSNPEFLREGSAVEDFFHPDRIVLGVESERAERKMRQIYEPLLAPRRSCPVHAACPPAAPPAVLVTDTNSAELIKHAANSFLAAKISYINMVADLCSASGANIDHVVAGLGLDVRIGPHFLRPGIGFGGFCFPKDLQAFVRIGEAAGCDFTLLREAERINAARIDRFLALMARELWVLRGKKLALWGLAFKPNTDDVRFAPALELARRLLAEGAELCAYDPQAARNAQARLPLLRCAGDPYEAAAGADALLILTEWDEFRRPDWSALSGALARPLIFDGRNLLSPTEAAAHGFQYFSIGRPPAVPAEARAPVAAVQGG